MQIFIGIIHLNKYTRIKGTMIRCCASLPVPITVRSFISVADLAIYLVVCHTNENREKASFARSCSATACSTTTAPTSMNHTWLWLDLLMLIYCGCRRRGGGCSCLRSWWWRGEDNWHFVVVSLLTIDGWCCLLLGLLSTKTGQFQLKF